MTSNHQHELVRKAVAVLESFESGNPKRLRLTFIQINIFSTTRPYSMAVNPCLEHLII